MPTTVVAGFTASSTADATRPLVTFYDDATGERTDLSGVTLRNWVAKTANLLRDGLGLGSGDVAAVVLPPHWQTAAVLLGCWSAGLAVDLAPGPGAGAAVAFTTGDQVGTVAADEVYALALAPLGVPFRPGPPPGSLDYVVEVRGHGDHFSPAHVPPAALALADGTTQAELVNRSARRGLSPGTRVLIDAAITPDPADWLVAPIMAGGSVVLCRNLDPSRVAARLAAERATLG